MGKMVLPQRNAQEIGRLLRSSVRIEDIVIGGFQEHQSVRSDGICPALTSSMGKGGGYTPMIVEKRCRCVGTIEGGGFERMFEEIWRVYDTDYCSPAVTAKKGGYHEVKIAIRNANKKGYEDAEDGDFVNLQYASSSTRRGRVGHQVAQTICCTDEQGVVVKDVADAYLSEKGVRYVLAPKRGACTAINGEVSQTLTKKGQNNWTGTFISPDIDHIENPNNIGGTEPTRIYLKNGEEMTSNDDLSKLRIRKLTPRECWRLMDFDDEDFNKAQAVESNTQLYAQAGNSIVVNCLVAIFGQMFDGKEEVYKERNNGIDV